MAIIHIVQMYWLYCVDEHNKAFKSDSSTFAGFASLKIMANVSSRLNAALVCKRKNAAISQDLVVKAQSLSCRIGFQFQC